uniref:Uncharacterized protein n=1 Tax=Lepeophtheirus salmonis TaxID=72036 RepID=A0A0K2VB41_LEPSM
MSTLTCSYSIYILKNER